MLQDKLHSLTDMLRTLLRKLQWFSNATIKECDKVKCITFFAVSFQRTVSRSHFLESYETERTRGQTVGYETISNEVHFDLLLLLHVKKLSNFLSISYRTC